MTQATNVIRLPKAKEAAIDSLLARTGYDITQENSQRKYGPPPDWKGPPPPRGSEIFIGKVPRDMYEDELVPIVEKIGKIYEMRLMMDFTGQNRGYAFVMYTCPEDAKRAIKELDNTEVKKGRFIGVCKSVDNCRLFVGGIPRTKTKEEIMEEMMKVTDQVCDVILYSSILDKSKNRGFAFVEYESHKAAAMARKKLMPGRIQLWGQDIAVDWAEPELEVDEDIMAKVTVLYVRNLMPTTTEEDIKNTFSLGNSLAIEKVKKLRDFAFVHYSNRENAQKAMDDLNGTDLDGSVIEVTWAKPVDRSTRQRNRSPGPPNTASYNPYLYPFPVDPFSGPVPFAPCQARNTVFPRMSLARRGRGAAGIRRYNRNFSPPTNHPTPYKHIEIPFVPVPHAYGQYPVANKLGRIPEEGKPYYQSDYSVYAPNSAGADNVESPMTSNAGGPGIPPPHFPAFHRIGQHGYYPLPAAFDDIGYYAIVHPAPPGPPPPSTAPPGPVSMY